MDLKNWSPLTLLDDELLNNIRLVHVLGRAVLLVTYDDAVLGFGPNSSGCLGVKSGTGKMCLFEPVPLTAMRGKLIKEFAVGGHKFDRTFVIACTFSGELYFWGKWFESSLDNPTELSDIVQPSLLPNFPRTISTVSCGLDHILALSDTGKIYGFGLNTYGQLGTGDGPPVMDEFDVLIEILGELQEKIIVKIACGSHFSAAVTDDGQIYTWGCNKEGQLGLAIKNEKVSFPTRVTCLNNTIMRKIACGPSHVLAISDIGELYVWGNNKKGQLGLKDIAVRKSPVKNNFIKRVVKVGASIHCSTSAALTENSEVFMWGDVNAISHYSPQKTPFKSIHEVFAHFATPSLTYKSVKQRPRSKSLIENLKDSFNVPEFSDLTIVVEEKQIFVHRTVLRLQSVYFKTMLQEHWSSEDQRIISIDRDYDTVFAYLQYLYTGELKPYFTLTLDVFALVHEYNDQVAQSYCEKILIKKMTIDNCATLYATAVKFDRQILRESSLSFISHHTNEVLNSSSWEDYWSTEIMREFLKECSQRKLFKS